MWPHCRWQVIPHMHQCSISESLFHVAFICHILRTVAEALKACWDLAIERFWYSMLIQSNFLKNLLLVLWRYKVCQKGFMNGFPFNVGQMMSRHKKILRRWLCSMHEKRWQLFSYSCHVHPTVPGREEHRVSKTSLHPKIKGVMKSKCFEGVDDIKMAVIKPEPERIQTRVHKVVSEKVEKVCYSPGGLIWKVRAIVCCTNYNWSFFLFEIFFLTHLVCGQPTSKEWHSITRTHPPSLASGILSFALCFLNVFQVMKGHWGLTGQWSWQMMFHSGRLHGGH